MEKIERAVISQNKGMGIVSETIFTYLLLSGFVFSLKALSILEAA